MQEKMEYKFTFENLDVWQRSRELTKKIYSVTRKFPEEERFGLVSQLRRSAVSICPNIAEGNSRKSVKDRANFFQIAYSSEMEVFCQLIISNDLGYINNKQLSEFRSIIREVSNKTNALYKKQFENK